MRENDERRRIYNKEFRRGRFFIGVTIVRVLYILAFVAACFIHLEPTGYHEEIVTSTSSYTYTIHSKTGSHTETELTINTDQHHYFATRHGAISSPFQKGDAVVIGRNILGRAICLAKSDWNYMYVLDNPLFFYFAVLGITLFSAFFHDGTAKFVLNFLKIIAAVDIIAILAYVFTIY